MPIYSAVSNLSFTQVPAFRLAVTLAGITPPDYGFHFHRSADTNSQCVFDNCEWYSEAEDLTLGIDPIPLLQQYELLFRHRWGPLHSKYYVVPWALLRDGTAGSPSRTIKLTVSPYSIYPQDGVAGCRQMIDDMIDANNSSGDRDIELVPESGAPIEAYWGTSTSTTIHEKDLKGGKPARIIVHGGEHVPAGEIERAFAVTIQQGSMVLGKISISLVRPLTLPICFLDVTQPTAGNYEARFLATANVPASYDKPAATLHVSLNAALAPYGIDVVPVDAMEWRDADGQVLANIGTALHFAAAFPVEAVEAPGAPAMDEATRGSKVAIIMGQKILDNIATTTYSIGGANHTSSNHKVLTVILMPWCLMNRGGTSGFTPPLTMVDGKIGRPLTSYMLPILRVQEYVVTQEKNNGGFGTTIAPANITIPVATNPYLVDTLFHEVCHGLLVPHTFRDGKTTSLIDSYNILGKTLLLSEFGEYLPSTDIPKKNLFSLMLLSDSKKAVIDQYIVGTIGNNDYSTPYVTGLNFTSKLASKVIFSEYKTNNVMDYYVSEFVSSIAENPPASGMYMVSIIWEDRYKYLFRYQWEMMRATTQYLAAQA